MSIIYLQLNYNFELEYNGQTYTYDRLMQITNGIVFYKQLHKIDDNEQTIEMDLKYNVIGTLVSSIFFVFP